MEINNFVFEGIGYSRTRLGRYYKNAQNKRMKRISKKEYFEKKKAWARNNRTAKTAIIVFMKGIKYLSTEY